MLNTSEGQTLPLDTSVATERTNCNIPAANSSADQEHTKTTQKTKAAVTASKRHPGPGRVSSRVAAVREIKKKVGCDRIITKPLCSYVLSIQMATSEIILGTTSCPSICAQILTLILHE